MERDKQILSDITVYTKYARYIPELQRRETWEELVTRNMNMHISKYPNIKEEIENVYKNFVYTKKVLPSMRSLQFGGRAIELNNARVYNCAYLPIEDIRSFSETMFLLLGGTGVGYSVQNHHVEKLPDIKKPNYDRRKRYVVQDSIIGWADAIKMLFKSYTGGITSHIQFDLTDIRQKGALLVTAGGKAPGPEPLRIALVKIEALLREKKDNTKLTDLECHDIQCHIADAVLAGGIRRAAMISLFDLNSDAVRDMRYRLLKDTGPPTEADDAPFLFSGNEDCAWHSDFGYYSNDMNGDGYDNEADEIFGLNTKPWPSNSDILIHFIASKRAGTESDDIVRFDRQILQSDMLINIPEENVEISEVIYNSTYVGVVHTDIVYDIERCMDGLDEPDNFEMAYKLSLNKRYNGFTTYQENSEVSDYDYFKFESPTNGEANIEISGIINTNQWMLKIFEYNNSTPVYYGYYLDQNSGSGGSLIFPVNQDQTYYIEFNSMAQSNSHPNPYEILITTNIAPPNCYVHDFDCDDDVDIVDISMAAYCFGTEVGDSNYDDIYDMDSDGDIDIVDISIIAFDYGWLE